MRVRKEGAQLHSVSLIAADERNLVDTDREDFPIHINGPVRWSMKLVSLKPRVLFQMTFFFKKIDRHRSSEIISTECSDKNGRPNRF